VSEAETGRDAHAEVGRLKGGRRENQLWRPGFTKHTRTHPSGLPSTSSRHAFLGASSSSAESPSSLFPDFSAFPSSSSSTSLTLADLVLQRPPGGGRPVPPSGNSWRRDVEPDSSAFHVDSPPCDTPSTCEAATFSSTYFFPQTDTRDRRLVLETVRRRDMSCSALSAGDTTPQVMLIPSIRTFSLAGSTNCCSMWENAPACYRSAPRKS